MALLLVRHGHAGDRDRWTGPDRLRPLSKKGIRQAEALVPTLAGFPVARVLSSPYLRCTQTVEPLARARNKPVEDCGALAEGNASAAVELVHSLAGGAVVLCTHGDVVDAVLAAGPTPADRRMKKASVWVLEAEDGRYVAARYLPPAG